jgi:hypothetical protein
MGFQCCQYNLPINLLLLLCCLCFGGVSFAGIVGLFIWYLARQNESEPSGDEK